MPQLNVAWSLKWSVRGKGPTWSAWSSWIFQAEEFKEPALNTSQAPRMPIPDYYTTGHVNLDLFPQTFQHCPALEESPTHMLGPWQTMALMISALLCYHSPRYRLLLDHKYFLTTRYFSMDECLQLFSKLLESKDTFYIYFIFIKILERTLYLQFLNNLLLINEYR